MRLHIIVFESCARLARKYLSRLALKGASRDLDIFARSAVSRVRAPQTTKQNVFFILVDSGNTMKLAPLKLYLPTKKIKCFGIAFYSFSTRFRGVILSIFFQRTGQRGRVV